MTTFRIVTAPPQPRLRDRLARMIGFRQAVHPSVHVKVYSTPTPCTYDDDPLGW